MSRSPEGRALISGGTELSVVFGSTPQLSQTVTPKSSPRLAVPGVLRYRHSSRAFRRRRREAQGAEVDIAGLRGARRAPAGWVVGQYKIFRFLAPTARPAGFYAVKTLVFNGLY
jgi:hypothetical protein